MTFDDLKRSAASLQRTEGSRQRLQASTINSIYKKALELDKINSDRLICDVIISKAAEELYSDEKLYLSALKKSYFNKKSYYWKSQKQDVRLL